MTTYYEKRGRRYIPVAEADTWTAIPFGTHAVTVGPVGQRWLHNVQPDRVAVEAAMLEAQDAMETALHQAMLLRPERRPMTPRERKAWEAYCAVLGGAPTAMRFEGISPRTVAEAAIAALRAKLNNA